MFLMGLGALLVLGGILYMARSAIWRGPLSGRDSSRPVRGTLEPPRRGLGFLGVGTNWPGFLMMAIGAVVLGGGGKFLPPSGAGFGHRAPPPARRDTRPMSH